MIKSGGKWFTKGKGKSCSQDLDWKKGETHHIVTSWGPKGQQLWLDGKLLGQAPGHKTGTTKMDKNLWIGNIENEKGSTLPSQWIQDELYIFDTQLEKAEVTDLMKSSLAGIGNKKYDLPDKISNFCCPLILIVTQSTGCINQLFIGAKINEKNGINLEKFVVCLFSFYSVMFTGYS